MGICYLNAHTTGLVARVLLGDGLMVAVCYHNAKPTGSHVRHDAEPVMVKGPDNSFLSLHVHAES
jgi:hypothetical protein